MFYIDTYSAKFKRQFLLGVVVLVNIITVIFLHFCTLTLLASVL